MNQPDLEDQIRQTRVKVALGRELIARQRAAIEALEKHGYRTAAAELALRAFETKQRKSLADLKQLAVKLALLSEPRSRSPSDLKPGK